MLQRYNSESSKRYCVNLTVIKVEGEVGDNQFPHFLLNC